MADYKKIMEEINSYTDIAEVIRFAKIHYRKLNRIERAQIFNQVIQDRQKDSEEFNFSLRLSVELSSMFILYKTNIMTFGKCKFDLAAEKEIFIIIIEKIYHLESKKVINNGLERNDFRRYFNYKYDYPSIHAYEYFKLFQYFDELSEDIYGLSVNRNFYNLLILLASTNNLYIKNKILKEEFRKHKNFDNLFIDSNEINEKMFIKVNLRTVFKGKLGIKFSDGLYVPRTHHLFENILRGILENEKSNDKKGDVLETYSKDIIGNFFEDIYHTLYDNKGNEQDLIITFEDIILFIECKSQNFKSIFIGKDATSTIEKHFKDVIVKACKQCQRGKDYLLNNNNVIYYNSNNKKERKEVLKISKTKNKKIYKIVVVLDEYLDLAELSNRYLEEKYKDTWVVNIFALQKILWISTRINGINTFFEYLDYRTQNYLAIESLHSDELAQFGYWISPNYHLYPRVVSNLNIVVGNRFSNVFEEYDSYFFKELEQELRVINE
ncbi:hypothetical protein [Oceanobacillus profundus]|uniref:NERD domain-containing protein n=1 Tax=Oceanobacillus profundus TaxID=372463 RepID=A0A417YHI4_9BACI|nr:hypothetical protein [Oceanobacillus profundus]RHW32351.1 hypothetical protein D1B32_11365 [Oceanobacillus profundus]